MNRFVDYFRGYAELEICGADPAAALNRLISDSVSFWNIDWIGPLTVRVLIYQKNENKALHTVENAFCDGIIISRSGLRQSAGGMLHRPVLLLMLLISLIAALVLPHFVLFYDVEGNETIPDGRILQELDHLGIGFGIYGPRIDPRWIKNQMLHAIPELQWVTVTQNGCKATVVVRERRIKPETVSKKGFSNIVASQSGIITSQSVLSGQAVHHVGDTVQKGELLVSGVVDLERIYVLEPARAEIFARTWRTVDVKIPAEHLVQTPTDKRNSAIWLVIGHKRIKIFGNSGIFHGSCDKMSAKIELALPDELTLPLWFELETYTQCDSVPVEMDRPEASALLMDYVCRYVQQDMQAGQIAETSYALECRNGCYEMQAELECHEMIAQNIEEKWNNEELLND